jgi:hypothetical protein
VSVTRPPLALSLTLVLALAGAAPAQTTYELTPADDWLSVINGEALVPGDTVILGAGTYTTPDAVMLNIGHVGTAADPITIKAAKGATATITRNTIGAFDDYYTNLEHNVVNMHGAQHVVLDGLTITGGNWGIRMSHKRDGNNPSLTQPLGDLVRELKHVTIQNCHIFRTHNTALSANMAGDVYDSLIIRDNEFHEAGRWGESIYLGNYDTDPLIGTLSIAKNCLVEGNYIHDNVWVNSWYQDPSAPSYHGTGIQLQDGCFNNQIRGNVIHYTRFPGILISGGQSTFGDNTSPGWARNVVEGNIIWQITAAPQDISGQGLQIAADCIVENNIVSAKRPFFTFDHQTSCGDLTVGNNTFISNTSLFSPPIEIGDVPSFPVLITNNALFRGPGMTTVIDGAGSGGALITDVANVAVTNIVTAFNDPLNFDYFPVAGSPVLAAADVLYQTAIDFNESCRGADLTAGAYIYDATGNPGWFVAPTFKLTLPHAATPASAAECPGASVTFTTVASGVAPFTYQWKKDGVVIVGATASSYTIASVSAGDAGEYVCMVTDACSSTTSDCATLTLNDLSATDPVDAARCPGTSVSFDTTAGGTGPFTYQWRKDGTDISGATASSYSIVAVVAGDAGDYDVVVTGFCGAVTSNAATLTVDTSPTASDPTGQSACPTASVTFSTTAGGSGPFTYQWKKDGIDIGGATASSHTINPVAAADAGDYSVEVTGACGTVTTAAATLTVDTPVTASAPSDATVCPGDPVTFSTTAGGTGPFTYQWKKDGVDIGGATASSHTIAAVVAGDAGTYSVLVTGACGSTEPSATLTVDAATTATDPLGATVCPGAGASFSTTAGGTGPFTYQWRKDAIDIGGATASSHTIAAATAGDAGDYTCAVTGTCGVAVTNAATLVVDAPTAATSPGDETRCPGTSVTFSTTASGTGPFTYQWKKDAIDIGGATASSYTIATVVAGDAGTYSVLVTGTCGSVEPSATLTVDTPVTASDPAGSTECPGNAVTFSTTAGGTGPFTYQWKKDAVNIGGATASSHMIAAVAAADAGSYTVEVTGACGTLETGAAVLVVDVATSATTPSDETRCPGTSVTFSTTASGTGPFTYQWKKDAIDIGGATSSSHTIAAVIAGDAGTYSVLVTGTCGSVEPSATLTVDAPVTASDPASVTECPGNAVTFSTTAGGTGPFTYQWKKDAVDIGGATASSYMIAAVAAADAGAYSVAVSGACGMLETAAATLTIDVATSATTPSDETRCPGTSVTFSTTASGTGPFTYQWKKDGIDIGGATASSHTIAAVVAGDAGTYSVLVAGACGSTEPSATLTVDSPVTASDPASAAECAGNAVTFSTVAGGTGPFTYQWKKDAIDIGGATSSSYMIAAVSAADTGNYTVVVTGACGALETAAATLTINSPVTASDPSGSTECPGNAVSFSTVAGGSGPFTYQWKKDGIDIGGATASSHSIASVVTADAGAYSVAVTGACGTLETGAAVLTVNDPVTASDPAGATVCPGASVTFNTVAGGTGPLTYQWKKDAIDIGGATGSSHTVNPVSAADAGAYTVAVTGACGTYETAAGVLTVDVPVTASQPADQTACTGDPATFSTTAAGTGPFTYQWKKDGIDIGGETASSYTIASVVTADAGLYSVLVTGACGSTEPSGTLTVNDALTASDPADQLVCLGGVASFTTTAGGTGPFTYQWKKDGLDIGGATTSTHTIAAVVGADAGDYSVAVTGACATLETAAATLTVGASFVNYCTAGTSASGCQATLSATGTPSATMTSGFTVTASNVEGDKDGLYFFGTSGRQANSWGSGTSFQCAVPPVVRTALMDGIGTPGLCDNTLARDMNALWCATCPNPLKNPGAGALVQLQLWYRDPFSTSNQTTSLSNALEFTVCP